MYLAYEDIVEMSILSEEFGGYTDGWGHLSKNEFVYDNMLN